MKNPIQEKLKNHTIEGTLASVLGLEDVKVNDLLDKADMPLGDYTQLTMILDNEDEQIDMKSLNDFIFGNPTYKSLFGKYMSTTEAKEEKPKTRNPFVAHAHKKRGEAHGGTVKAKNRKARKQVKKQLKDPSAATEIEEATQAENDVRLKELGWEERGIGIFFHNELPFIIDYNSDIMVVYLADKKLKTDSWLKMFDDVEELQAWTEQNIDWVEKNPERVAEEALIGKDPSGETRYNPPGTEDQGTGVGSPGKQAKSGKSGQPGNFAESSRNEEQLPEKTFGPLTLIGPFGPKWEFQYEVKDKRNESGKKFYELNAAMAHIRTKGFAESTMNLKNMSEAQISRMMIEMPKKNLKVFESVLDMSFAELKSRQAMKNGFKTPGPTENAMGKRELQESVYKMILEGDQEKNQAIYDRLMELKGQGVDIKNAIATTADEFGMRGEDIQDAALMVSKNQGRTIDDEEFNEGYSDAVINFADSTNEDNEIYRRTEIAKSIDPRSATGANFNHQIIVPQESKEKILSALQKAGYTVSFGMNEEMNPTELRKHGEDLQKDIKTGQDVKGSVVDTKTNQSSEQTITSVAKDPNDPNKTMATVTDDRGDSTLVDAENVTKVAEGTGEQWNSTELIAALLGQAEELRDSEEDQEAEYLTWIAARVNQSYPDSIDSDELYAFANEPQAREYKVSDDALSFALQSTGFDTVEEDRIMELAGLEEGKQGWRDIPLDDVLKMDKDHAEFKKKDKKEQKKKKALDDSNKAVGLEEEQAIVWTVKPPKGTKNIHPDSKWPAMKPGDINKYNSAEKDLDEDRIMELAGLSEEPSEDYKPQEADLVEIDSNYAESSDDKDVFAIVFEVHPQDVVVDTLAGNRETLPISSVLPNSSGYVEAKDDIEAAQNSGGSDIDWEDDEDVDSNFGSSMMEEESGIEAYGVKGMKSTKWRKTFKNAEALEAWLEKNDAEVQGQRQLDEESITEKSNQQEFKVVNLAQFQDAEYGKRGSDKVWGIIDVNNQLFSFWGARGKALQYQRLGAASMDVLSKARTKFASKLKKGYKEIVHNAPGWIVSGVEDQLMQALTGDKVNQAIWAMESVQFDTDIERIFELCDLHRK